MFQCYRQECIGTVEAASSQLEQFQATYDQAKADLKESTTELSVTEKV